MLNENRTDAASIASDSGHDLKVVSTKKSSAESTTKPAKKTRTEATRDAVTMRKHFVLDTNVLLHNAGSIFKFAEHEVVIPLAVIEELDGFKKGNDETGRNARQVTRALDRLRSQGALFQGVVWNEQGGSIRVARCDARTPFALDLDKADNRILAVASELHAAGHRTIFISKDINARVKSDALGIAAEDFEADHIVSDFLHAGYIVMKVPGEIIDELYDERQLRIERLMEFEATAPDGQRVEVEAVANQFIMLVDAMDEHHTGLARMLADTGAAIPVTGPRKPVYGIMGRNVQQTMALELLLDDDVKIVTLTGPAGTGKTLLALACGLHKTLKEERFDKLLTARPIMPLGRDIGYLPGDKDEKLSMWMQPIFDNISYLLSTRGSHSDERPESRTAEQRLDQLMATGRVVLEPLTYIRGRSIPHQFMIVDEAQNLSPHEIKTIVSRVGDGTKIVLCGDVLQIDNPYLDAASNGLAHCIERMKGQRIAGHVSLSKTERSHLASLAAEIL